MERPSHLPRRKGPGEVETHEWTPDPFAENDECHCGRGPNAGVHGSPGWILTMEAQS